MDCAARSCCSASKQVAGRALTQWKAAAGVARATWWLQRGLLPPDWESSKGKTEIPESQRGGISPPLQ